MPVKKKTKKEIKSKKKTPKVVRKRKYSKKKQKKTPKKTPKVTPKKTSKKTLKKKQKKTPKVTPKVTPHILEIPEKDHPSSLNGNFNDGVWIVLYHATWCPHCEEMKPEWDKLKHIDLPVNIVDIESEALDLVDIPKDIEGFPTISIFSNGVNMESLEGDRSLYNMLNLVSKYI